MYSVAVNTDKGRFSITCRDFDRSQHWHKVSREGNPALYHDTRHTQYYKPYTVLGEFETESLARKFKAVIEAAYIANGYTPEFINA